MDDLRTRVSAAIAAGTIEPRVWVYSNYHCNLRCHYCLVESSPTCERREVGPELLVDTARRAAELGFREIGITGGEPFLLPYLPEVLDEISTFLPVLVLTNGAVLDQRRLAQLTPLADRPIRIQISLDHPDPVVNDQMRDADGYRRAVEGIVSLVRIGMTVRIASTVPEDEVMDGPSRDMRRLCELHRGLGVPDEEHVIRPIVSRGRAGAADLGRSVTIEDFVPELTLTADGAFWSPFSPTIRDGQLDTDMLVSRTTRPLERPLSRMLALAERRPEGHDARSGVR